MSKRVLIIGTSHTFGDCEKEESPRSRTHSSNMWYYNFYAELGWEIVTLSWTGITIHQQFVAVYEYFKDNPNERFDLAILESRSIDTNVTLPIDNSDHQDKKAWEVMQLDTIHQRQAYPATGLGRSNVGEMIDNEHKRYAPFFVDYVKSRQHILDNASLVRSFCTFLEKHVSIVRYMVLSSACKDLDQYGFDLTMGYDLIDDWLIGSRENTWPEIKTKPYGLDDDLYRCKCSHFNILGQRKIWENIVKPEVERLFNE